MISRALCPDGLLPCDPSAQDALHQRVQSLEADLSKLGESQDRDDSNRERQARELSEALEQCAEWEQKHTQLMALYDAQQMKEAELEKKAKEDGDTIAELEQAVDEAERHEAANARREVMRTELHMAELQHEKDWEKHQTDLAEASEVTAEKEQQAEVWEEKIVQMQQSLDWQREERVRSQALLKGERAEMGRVQEVLQGERAESSRVQELLKGEREERDRVHEKWRQSEQEVERVLAQGAGLREEVAQWKGEAAGLRAQTAEVDAVRARAAQDLEAVKVQAAEQGALMKAHEASLEEQVAMWKNEVGNLKAEMKATTEIEEERYA